MISIKNNIAFLSCVFCISILYSCKYSRDRFSSEIKVNVQEDFVFLKQSDTKQSDTKEPTLYFNENGRIFYFSKIYGVMKFYPLSSAKVDMNYLFRAYYNLAKDASSETQYYEIMEKFILECGVENDERKKNLQHIFQNYSFSFDEKMSVIYQYIFNSNSLTSQYVFLEEMGNISFPTQKKYKYPNINLCEESVKIWVLADFWNVINFFYVHKNLLSDNWDSVLYCYINKFQHVDMHEFMRLFLKLTTHIEDNIVSVNSNYIAMQTGILGTYIPDFYVKKINENFVVSDIFLEEYSHHSILRGDIVLQINGTHLIERYDSLQQYFSHSNKSSKDAILCKYVLNSTQKNNSLLILRNGKVDSINVNFRQNSEYEELFGQHRRKAMYQVKVKKYSNIAYLHIKDLYRANFDETMLILKQSNKLILDLRGEANPHIVDKLLDLLLPPKQSISFFYPDIRNSGQFLLHSGYYVGENDMLSGKKIILLVDAQTQFQSEFIAMTIKQCAVNVKIIGSQTGGSFNNAINSTRKRGETRMERVIQRSGTIATYELPNNIKIFFPTIGFLYSDNIMVSKEGVLIDSIIEPNIQDIQESRDAILDSAIKTLQDSH
jgi:hypothetical protein